MELKCINVKNYKLTEYKVYACIKSEDSYYYIINDAGNLVRYIKELFEIVELLESENNTEPAIIEQTLISIRTLENVIESFRIDEVEKYFYFTDLKDQARVINFNCLENIESPISCGIRMIDGLNRLFEQINDCFDYDDDYEHQKKCIFKSILEHIITTSPECAILLFSTNLDNDNDYYFEILDDKSSFQSAELYNPNSGNNIQLWGINI